MVTLKQVEEGQVGCYLVALLAGLLLGAFLPTSGLLLEAWIEPVLAVLLYAMFAQIPFLQLRAAFSHWRFMSALCVANFIIVPLLVWVLTRFLPNEPPLVIGVTLVLLAPCIDYVVVFTHLGRGNAKLVLAATPLLLLLQIILIPVYLWLIVGEAAASLFKAGPLLRAFLILIAVPLACAVLTEWLSARHRLARQWHAATAWLPVPVMALVLFIIVASQVPKISGHLWLIASAVPAYIAFMLIMPLVAKYVALGFQLETGAGRALVFSASTRNSLVVLPLAFALPDPMRTLVAAVIVTQTLVELLGELIYVKLVPKLVTDPD
ncbi:arsenic resistance protein [Allohahella marinimesophila]|uniref:Arsenic resistance protein n=1 Tax=Allohahella marinimesophila TaxID=1054972 RepID=A0ABP7NWW2_9GAMM